MSPFELNESPQSIVDRLIDFQAIVRDALISCRSRQSLHEVSHTTAADTIYAIDAEVDPILESFCEEWGKTTPLVLIAEGMTNHEGKEANVVFPRGMREEQAMIRLIVDPIDGTRGIMYDKRSAWALAGVAPNRGPRTRLRDIQISVMTELPTSKSAYSDVLWAIKGHGAKGRRTDLRDRSFVDLPLQPSQAETIRHGFASVSNFFPGTKVLASQLMEYLVTQLLGPADVNRAMIFDDQYISTGGQWYELIVGHDRFNCDLRPLFYKLIKKPEGLCVHPYDCAAWLIAEEAGVILTDGWGAPLDGPLDCTTSLSWAGFANPRLYEQIQPLICQFLTERGLNMC